jgi:hypothetical protein
VCSSDLYTTTVAGTPGAARYTLDLVAERVL